VNTEIMFILYLCPYYPTKYQLNSVNYINKIEISIRKGVNLGKNKFTKL